METKDAVTKLSALAQETRLDIFRLLVRHGNEALPAGRIADTLDLPANTLSFHLKELQNAGLITSERQGRFILYQLHIPGMSDLLGFLSKDCCQGRPDLCCPKT
ncbi:MAG: ArsR/SmtB family transcription factor [Verrucomicrobiales bacterium]